MELKQSTSQYKHLTLEDRVIIEDRLNHSQSIRSIAKELDRSPSTILREIKNHSTMIKSTRNDCANRRYCNHHGLCGKPGCTGQLCRKCKIPCKKYCPDYVKTYCDRQLQTPYVCNSCPQRELCQYDKTIYRANQAESLYRDTLISTRTGFDLTDAEIEKVNKLASPLLKNGLSPYHVKQTFGGNLPVSESTLRRMIDKNELDARNIDLRDKVRRKPRRTTNNKSRNQTLSALKIGHFYGDYLKYLQAHDVMIVEMDCVEGKQNESTALLTLTFKALSLQIAFILDSKDSVHVVETLNKIERSLGKELFAKMFPVILTDNGPEFSDISGMELSCIDGLPRTRIYFCEPNRSDEKGTCENHHKMIRYIIPKGTSLEPYSQADITLMMNHINSYKRKALFGKSAYDLSMSILPEDFFVLLGLESIPAEEIILKPSLIQKLS